MAVVPATAETGARLASGGDDGTVRLWDLGTGQRAGSPLVGHSGPVSALAAVAAGDGTTLLASGGDDGTVRLWNLATGRSNGPVLTGRIGAVQAMTTVSTVDGRQLLAVAGANRMVRLWDASTGQPVGGPLAGHTDHVLALAAIPTADGRTLLASAGPDGMVRLWDPATGEPVGGPLSCHTDHVLALAAVPVSNGRTLLASAGADRLVRLWDPSTGEPVGGPLSGHTDMVRALAVLPTADGRSLLACGSGDGTVIWDVEPLSRVTAEPADEPAAPAGPPSVGHASSVFALTPVSAADGRILLASTGQDATVWLWDSSTGRRIGRPLTGHKGAIRALTTVPATDGRTVLASAGDDATVRLWDPATGQPVGDPLAGHTAGVCALAVLPTADGRTWLASAGEDATMVWSWDSAGRPSGRKFTGPRAKIRALATVPAADGRTLLASAGDDGNVRLRDPSTGRPVGNPFTGHKGAIRALTTVPVADGRTVLASAGDDATVRLWDPSTGRPVGEPLDAAGPVRALAALRATGGRTLLASANTEGTVLLRPVMVSRAPLFRGAGDAAAAKDLLGRESLVDVLSDLVSGTGATPPPAVVSVEGRWGAGRTSVLIQLHDLLRSADEPGTGDAAPGRPRRRRLTAGAAARLLSAAGSPGNRPVGSPGAGASSPRRQVVGWFNPWAHQSADQVWAGLAQSVLSAAGPAVHGGRDTDRERYWFTRNLLRVDRRELHRLLWRRMCSPLLALGVVALAVPLVAAATTRDSQVTLLGERVPAGLLAAVLPAVLLLLGLLHTAGRYVFARASAFLPDTLFTGPVLGDAPARTGTAPDPARPDPLRRSRSGYLYLVQHDVGHVLEDLAAAGGELVLFVDDLDRCTPGTTAQVFEAINLFLSEQLPRVRFVIGLDPEIVRAHLDRTHTEPPITPGIALAGDGSPGWASLRKLIQLPVMLPAVTGDGLERVLDDVLGSVDRTAGTPIAPAGSSPRTTPADGDGTRPATPTDQIPVRLAPASRPGAAAVTETPAGDRTTTQAAAGTSMTIMTAGTQLRAILEHHPAIRDRLRERLARQPERSVRDTKRLLTLWQFYARLLDKVDHLDDDPDVVDRALHLIIVAEIITRWPAHQTAFRRRIPAPAAAPFAEFGPTPERGLQLLAAAAGDDAAWARAVTAVLPAPVDELRELLRDYDGAQVAALHARLT